MDNKLQDALKKANAEVEKVGITDPELKKIAFSKAVDFYLNNEKVPATVLRKDNEAGAAASAGSDFWTSLRASTDLEEKKLKDVYSVKDGQVLVVMSSFPGDSKADKQRNLAALVLLAYGEGMQEEWVSSTRLAEAAQHSKLYDTSKFAKNLRHQWFRAEGVKKGLKYKLSGPGLSAAKNLLSSIT